jgi:hypothetical protein
MPRLRREKVENGVGAGPQSVFRGPPWGRHIWDSAKVDSVAWLGTLRVGMATVVLRRVVDNKAAGEWRGGG